MSRNTITVSEWSEREFASHRHEWNRLLELSEADPLFMSWEWQFTWWQTFANHRSTPLILVAKDQSGRLLGIAPLHYRRLKARSVIPVRRLQFIGNCWWEHETFRSEHLDFITDRQFHQPVLHAFWSYLEGRLPWDEFVFADLKRSSPTLTWLAKTGSGGTSFGRREAATDKSFYIATDGDFDGYLAARGKNLRLQLFNRRKRLASLGEVRLEFAGDTDFNTAYRTLARLHETRWSGAVFSGDSGRFQELLARRMMERGGLRLSTLFVGERPVSCLLNFIARGQEYNIQGGFDHTFDKKLALGYLHLGYTIEQAFESDVARYNLLVGSGKNDDYKERLTTQSEPVVDLQIVKSASHRLLYSVRDQFSKWRNMAVAARLGGSGDTPIVEGGLVTGKPESR